MSTQAKIADDKWTRVATSPPPEGVYVYTKIDDEHGPRNEQLMHRKGRLWFCRDGLYVYYTPTHWHY